MNKNLICHAKNLNKKHSYMICYYEVVLSEKSRKHGISDGLSFVRYTDFIDIVKAFHISTI